MPFAAITIVPTFGIVAAVVPALKTTGLLLPSTIPAIVNVVTVTGPSTLLVPVNTVPLTGVSSGVEFVSTASTNGSFTGVIVSVKVETSVAPEVLLTV